MFGLFKNNKVTDEQNELLISVFKKLPSEFDPFVKQLKSGLLNRKLPSSKAIAGFIGFSYNGQISKLYEKANLGAYKLSPIKIYDKKSQKTVILDIYTSAGLVTGYTLGTASIADLDLNKIDISDYKKLPLDSENSEFETVKVLLSPTDVMLIDPTQVYSVDLDGKIYYHLEDLEDGDFIGIDNAGILYEITHDPYEIKRIAQSLKEYMEGIKGN